jgi:hypothetical protein
MLSRDFQAIVVTRQNEDGKWQFAVNRVGRPLRWACGEYTTEKGARAAAQRRCNSHTR